jgi:hypothetical protein
MQHHHSIPGPHKLQEHDTDHHQIQAITSNQICKIVPSEIRNLVKE